MIASGGIVGNAGGPYTTFQGSLNVHNPQLHNQATNELFHRHAGITSLLAATVNVGDTAVQVANDAAFTVGDAVQINNGNIETTFPIITGKPGGNILTFDRPLDFAYAINDSVEKIISDLRITAGTLAAPVVYQLKPEAGKLQHIHRIILAMTHSAQSTDDKFGSINALTNGVVLRTNVNGQFTSFTNWKTNGDIILDMFNINYSDKSGPSLFGTSGRLSFSRLGVIIKLNGDVGDFMDIMIQDDLTGLASFSIKGQGFLEDT